MGARGPKPGFKAARLVEGASVPLSSIAAPVEPPVAAVLSAADRENPAKLSGEALRTLAHRRGISLSELQRMDDGKIRQQLHFLIIRQYAEA